MKSDNIKILGLIGIRSGSTGVKDKNIKNLGGRPLVSWILKTAKKSKYINRLIVSTDSKKYAQIASNCGAEIPCLRPKALATKNCPEIKYVKHMLGWLKKKENYSPDIVVRMMATVPFQSVNDIDAIIGHLIRNKKTDSSVVISEARQHPLKALKINNKKGVKKLVSFIGNKGKEVGMTLSRHIYEKAFFRANVIACRTKLIKKTNSLTGKNVKFHIIPQERAIDIDSLLDFNIVNMLVNKKSL